MNIKNSLKLVVKILLSPFMFAFGWILQLLVVLSYLSTPGSIKEFGRLFYSGIVLSPVAGLEMIFSGPYSGKNYDLFNSDWQFKLGFSFFAWVMLLTFISHFT